MSPLPLSNIFTQTPQVIYHRKRKNQGGLPTCKRSAIKKLLHPYSRSEKTSQVERKRNVFTSKSSLEFGEDVKKTFGFEWRAFVGTKAWREDLRLRSAIFFAKKMAAGNFYRHPPFWTAFWGEKLRTVTAKHTEIFNLKFFNTSLANNTSLGQVSGKRLHSLPLETSLFAVKHHQKYKQSGFHILSTWIPRAGSQ